MWLPVVVPCFLEQAPGLHVAIGHSPRALGEPTAEARPCGGKEYL